MSRQKARRKTHRSLSCKHSEDSVRRHAATACHSNPLIRSRQKHRRIALPPADTAYRVSEPANRPWPASQEPCSRQPTMPRENRVLEMLAKGDSLAQILDTL